MERRRLPCEFSHIAAVFGGGRITGTELFLGPAASADAAAPETRACEDTTRGHDRHTHVNPTGATESTCLALPILADHRCVEDIVAQVLTHQSHGGGALDAQQEDGAHIGSGLLL